MANLLKSEFGKLSALLDRLGRAGLTDWDVAAVLKDQEGALASNMVRALKAAYFCQRIQQVAATEPSTEVVRSEAIKEVVVFVPLLVDYNAAPSVRRVRDFYMKVREPMKRDTWTRMHQVGVRGKQEVDGIVLVRYDHDFRNAFEVRNHLLDQGIRPAVFAELNAFTRHNVRWVMESKNPIVALGEYTLQRWGSDVWEREAFAYTHCMHPNNRLQLNLAYGPNPPAKHCYYLGVRQG